jgi:hypothetical protein
MEQPSVTLTATKSVDYLGQTHNWTDIDIISSYKEVSKQLDTVQEKLREENEQKLNNKKLRKSSSHSKQLSQKAAQISSQSQQSLRGGRNNNNNNASATIGNISKQLKQQRDESALRAEEKRLIRMKNALWRRMGPSVGCVGKGNKLVSPKTLKWQKECDILWLFGPLYQPDNDPFMEDDDDKTLVGSPPSTGCPPSPTLSPYSSTPSSPSIKPALKKPVEYDPLKDLISYACEVLTNEKPYHGRRHTTAPLPKQKKKSIRFSRDLEQVHYTPTHYTIRPSPVIPPTRRRMSNPFFAKMEQDLLNGKNVEQYDQIFAWAKEQVKSSGKLRLFGEDGTWSDGNSDEDDEFVMPPLPPLVKSIPSRRSPSASPRSPNRRSHAAPPASYTATAAKNSAKAKNNFVDLNQVSSHVVVGDSETSESGVVERCANIASNVKEVVSWCGSMLWNSTIF